VTFVNRIYFFVALLDRRALGFLLGTFATFLAWDGDFFGVLRASLLFGRVFLAVGCFCPFFRFGPEARRHPPRSCAVAPTEIAEFIVASFNEPLAPLPVGCSKRPKVTAAFKYSMIAGDNVSASTLYMPRRTS
jgi:hypothetical protein